MVKTVARYVTWLACVVVAATACVIVPWRCVLLLRYRGVSELTPIYFVGCFAGSFVRRRVQLCCYCSPDATKYRESVAFFFCRACSSTHHAVRHALHATSLRRGLLAL